MKILISNLILYTNETRKIINVESIKDTMIYNLCLAFKNKGHDVTLAASDLYKPIKDEEYPFKIVWLKTKFTKLFPANVIPCCPGIKKLAKNGKYDLIISSEVFSLCSFFLACAKTDNLIIWQELAKHNKILNGKASKIWYNIIARICFKNTVIISRSEQAKQFISQFLNNVSDEIIDHGVNTDKFAPCINKKNQFAISSQLIKRKHIEKSIAAFANYLKCYNDRTKLFIMGDGEEKNNLQNLVNNLGISENIIFTGKLDHSKLTEILKESLAMLVYTEKDNNMVSVVESIALATPIVTTSVPYNSSYIKSENLGIVNDEWNEEDLNKISSDNDKYVSNCLEYSKTLPWEYKVDQFIKVYNNMQKKKDEK